MRFKSWAGLLLFPAVVLLAMACGDDEDSGREGLAATPTPASEPTVPSDFTTYTDEVQLFSISYPSDWELALSEIPGTEEAIREYFQSRELEDAVMIFFAKAPGEAGANIVVEPLDVSTLEEAAEAATRGFEALGLECKDFAQVEALVGNREALIFDRECDLPDLRKERGIQMLVLDGETLWSVNCTAPSEEFPSVEETCNQLVRSLRILR